MSKKKPRTPDLESLSPYNQGLLQHLRSVRGRLAAEIIGRGLFTDEEVWTDVVGTIAEAEASPLYDKLLTQLRKQMNLQDAEHGLSSLGTIHADAGFVVGLAVGMQLGPHALDGSDR